MVQYRPSEIIKILEKKGFILSRIKGSHHLYLHPESRKKQLSSSIKKNFLKRSFIQSLNRQGLAEKT